MVKRPETIKSNENSKEIRVIVKKNNEAARISRTNSENFFGEVDKYGNKLL